MPWFRKYFKESPDNDNGGGGGGGGEDKNKPDAEALAKENADLKAKLADFEKKNQQTPPKKDEDLTDHARRAREDAESKRQEHSNMESAMRFTLSAKEFLKENEATLPKEVADIFTAAQKETYDSEVHKANAIKDGINQEFFKLQANLDLLTSTQKNTVEKYLKLTKTAREAEARHVFENILEPTLEAQKRIKKAEEVNRAKGGYGNDNDKAYREKLMAGSRKHYLGEKK